MPEENLQEEKTNSSLKNKGKGLTIFALVISLLNFFWLGGLMVSVFFLIGALCFAPTLIPNAIPEMQVSYLPKVIIGEIVSIGSIILCVIRKNQYPNIAISGITISCLSLLAGVITLFLLFRPL